MKNKKSVSMRRKNKMSKTRKNKKTKNTTKKIGGSTNLNQNYKKLDSLYKERGDFTRELRDKEGKIYAIKTKQHLDPNNSIAIIEAERNNLENKINILNEKIEKEEKAWNKNASNKLSNIANNGIKNAIKRSKTNNIGTIGGATLLLIGVVSVIFAVNENK